jgi:hypothetical protein
MGGVAEYFEPMTKEQMGEARSFLALYRGYHDYKEGQECKCGLCRLVRESGIPLPDLRNMISRGTVEECFLIYDAAKNAP